MSSSMLCGVRTLTPNHAFNRTSLGGASREPRAAG
jgi:hypothetical protein